MTSERRRLGEGVRLRGFLRLLRSGKGTAGLLIVLLCAGTAFLAPWISPHAPDATDWSAVRQAPTPAHPFGTDDLGRDVLSRVLWGGRTSLLAGVLSVFLAMAVGVPLGLASGYFGGWLDEVVMRITDALLSFPFLILAIALAATLGPSLGNVMIAIAVATTPVFLRLARGQALAVREEDFVEAARAMGAPHHVILLRHVLPNCRTPIVVQATSGIAAAIIAESSLSFLGLGVQPPAPSWGSMLNVAKNFMGQAPWMAIWPGLFIFVTVMGFNLLGDGLRDLFDPRDQT
ncbi:ABC transporter permease [Limnochorda pilosa]|uniref:ABC transporter permease n=1 Tax=Limnochorda pilosa TaxID=1555112 RepID=UPI00082FEDBB